MECNSAIKRKEKKKLKTGITYNPATPVLGIYIYIYIKQNHNSKDVFIAALFTIPRA